MIKKFLLGVLTLGSITTSLAQRNSASPYSFFGIGDSFEAVTAEQAAMGGIGTASKENNYLNFSNPAALADLRISTYGIGGNLRFSTLEENNNTQSGNSANLRYVALGIPIGKKAGFTAGLQPFSSVGYSLFNRKTEGEDIIELTRFYGTGGLNKIYAGFGLYAYKGLSVGVEAGFIFGSLENEIINQKQNVSLATKYAEDVNVRGGQFKLGAQYKYELKNKLNLNLGAAITLESNLTGTGNERMYSLSFGSSGQEIPRDMLFDRGFSREITSPIKTSFGVGLGKTNKWYLEINQDFQKAFSGISSSIASTESYRYEDAKKLAIGGYYIPKINSISSYWDRVTYRAGVRIEDTGLQVSTNNATFTSIKDFGINVGVGLPLPRALSNVNIGFEYGQRGTTDNNLVKENYYNIRLSLSLNDLNWFNKRRID